MNEITKIKINQFDVNDDSSILAEWLMEDKSPVAKGDLIVALETSKAVYEMEATSDGYLRILGEIGKSYQIGEVVGYITPSPDTDLPREEKKESLGSAPSKGAGKWSKKALEAASKYNVDMEAIKSDGIITEKDVLLHVGKSEGGKGGEENLPYTKNVVFYGASSSMASLIELEIIARMPNYHALCFVDDDTSKFGKTIFGLKVYSWEDFLEKRDELNVSHFFISIGNVVARKAKFKLCEEAGLQGITLCHPSAEVSEYTEIGNNVLIKRGAIIGPGAVISDGCTVDNGAVVSHDCFIEPFAYLSPRVALGGYVRVKTMSIVGVGASVATSSTIGRGVIVGTGATVVGVIDDQVVIQGNPGRVVGASNIPLEEG